MVLREEDELTALSSYPTVSALLQADVRQGSCEVLPGSELHASDWYAETIGLAGGDYLPPWWDPDPIVRCRAVNLFRVCDGYYMPAFGTVVTESGEVLRSSFEEARYPTPTFDLLPEVSFEEARAVFNPPEHVPFLDSAIVSMPWGGISNYGHFVLDCLPTLSLAADIPQLSHYRRVFPQLSAWHRRHLALLGVTDPLELDKPLYRVSDLVFSNCMACFLNTPNVTYRRVREVQLARRRATGLAFEKIYLSRQGAFKRPFRSEQALEERLRDNGFAVIAPEQYTVDEQIDIFHAARLIVGCAGAAFANVLYCREGTTVVEITPSPMVPDKPLSGRWVYSLCALLKCKWRPYYSSRIQPDASDKPEHAGRPERGFTFDLDIDDLVNRVRALEL